MIPYWAKWLAWGLLILATFAPLEGYAMRHPDRGHTLSYYVAELGARFPLSIAVFGAVVGGLTVHFFWHFCPAFTHSMG